MKNWVAVAWVVMSVGMSAAFADDQSSDAEVRMLRAAVKNSAAANQPLRDKITELNKSIETLRSNLVARESELQATVKSWQAKAEELQKSIDLLTAERDRLRGFITPAPKGVPEGAITVSPAQLEAMGEQFVGKRVYLSDIEFTGVSSTWIDDIPGVTISSNGLESIINTNERKKWVGFTANAFNSTDMYMRLFTPKETYGDLVVGLKYGRLITATGFVVKMAGVGNYGILCDKIEASSTVPPDRRIKIFLPSSRPSR